MALELKDGANLFAFCSERGIALPADLSVAHLGLPPAVAFDRILSNLKWMNFYESYPFFARKRAKYYLPWYLDYLALRCCRVTFVRCCPGSSGSCYAQYTMYEGQITKPLRFFGRFVEPRLSDDEDAGDGVASDGGSVTPDEEPSTDERGDLD